MGRFISKKDDVAKISTSIFVTNFPEACSAKELFTACKQYGHVVDSFIPIKRSKTGKRFGFVRFINVFNEERLVNNLCTVWIDRFKLQANIARFHRPPVNGNKLHEKKNVGTTNSNLHRNECGNSKSFASALNSHAPVHTKLDPSSPAIVLDDVCLKESGMWVLLTFDDEGTKEKLLNHKGAYLKRQSQNTFARIVSAWGVVLDEEINVANLASKRLFMQEKNSDHPKQPSINVPDPSSQDPFGIYKILNRNYVEKSPSNGDPKFPPGFTPDVVSEHVTGEVEAQKHTAEGISQPQKTYVDTNDGVSSSLNGNNFSKHIKTGGSILEVMDELVKIWQTMG
ncbi:nucleotide-binding alpha-beta plait domain-containing protein [Tanacetum coccineum]